jgi:hypothetical protein
LLWASGFVLGIVAGIILADAIVAGDDAPAESERPGAQARSFVSSGEGPVLRNAKQGDLDLSMVIAPGRAGRNDLNFYLIDTDRDWKEVQRFVVRFTYLDGALQQDYELAQLHEGHFPLEVLGLPYAGRWQAEVSLLRAEAGESRFTFDFQLPHP